MNRVGMLLLALLLVACGARQAVETPPPPAADAPALPPGLLADRGLAPELRNELWLNSAAPVTLADLRGQVVLLTVLDLRLN